MRKGNMTTLTSIFVMALVAAGVGMGTMAYFSDTETSENNIFTAGTLDLAIDIGGTKWPDGVWYGDEIGESVPAFFEPEDVKPGDFGEATISLHVTNDAWARVVVIATSNAENGMNEPEREVDDTFGMWGGELHKYLRVSLWLDNGDNIHQDDEPYLYGGYYGDPVTHQDLYYPVYDMLMADVFPTLVYPNDPGEDHKEFCVIPGYLKASETTYIGISWRVDENAGNEIQSDSISITVRFEAKQYRNFEDDPFRFQNEPKL